MNVIPPLSNQVLTELIINYEYPRKNNPIEDAALEYKDNIRYIQIFTKGFLYSRVRLNLIYCNVDEIYKPSYARKNLVRIITRFIKEMQFEFVASLEHYKSFT